MRDCFSIEILATFPLFSLLLSFLGFVTSDEQFNSTLSFYMRFMSWKMGAKCPLEEVEVIIRENINNVL